MCESVCMSMCLRVDMHTTHARVCVCVCACKCTRVCVNQFAKTQNNLAIYCFSIKHCKTNVKMLKMSICLNVVKNCDGL